jgi:hypothetical protein
MSSRNNSEVKEQLATTRSLDSMDSSTFQCSPWGMSPVASGLDGAIRLYDGYRKEPQLDGEFPKVAKHNTITHNTRTAGIRKRKEHLRALSVYYGLVTMYPRKQRDRNKEKYIPLPW